MKTATTRTIKNIEEALEDLNVNENTLTAEEKHSLDEQGYIIVKNAIDPKSLKKMQAVFEELANNQREDNGKQAKQESGTRHVDIFGKHLVFELVYTHPKLMAAAWRVLQREFRFTGMHGRDPLPGFGLQGLHPDWGMGDPHLFYVVTSLWMLDDFTAENGATRIVPGTHLQRNKPPKNLMQPTANHPNQIQVIAPAGSALIFNGHLWHSGYLNRSFNSHRRALQCTCHAVEASYFTPNLEHPESLFPAARYILGVS